MLWQDRAYLVAVGTGTVLSFAHYIANVSSVKGQVPIHFNILGVPDSHAAPWAFVLYPLMASMLGITAAATTLPASSLSALPLNSVEQVAARVSVLCAYVVLLSAQAYSTRIADGTASRLPQPVMWFLYGTLGASVVTVLISKTVHK